MKSKALCFLLNKNSIWSFFEKTRKLEKKSLIFPLSTPNSSLKLSTAAAQNQQQQPQQRQQPSGFLAPFSGTEAQRDNGGALVEVRLDFTNNSAAEDAAAALRKSTAGTGQLATAMGTRGVQTKGLNVLSTRVSHLFPEPKKTMTTEVSTKGGDVSTPATPKLQHSAAIAAVFALFGITAALSGSVVYVRKRRSAAALAAAECPLAPSATTTEESEQGNVSPRPSNSNKSKVTEDGGALEAAEDPTTTTKKNSRRRGPGANSGVPFGSSTSSSSDESGSSGSSAAASETRPLSGGGRRGESSSSARASSSSSKKGPAPASHKLTSADDAV